MIEDLDKDGRTYKVLSKYLTVLDESFERYFLTIFYFYIFFIIATSVVTRYVFGYSPVWTTDTAIFMYIYLSWIGTSWNVRQRSHIRVDFVQSRLPDRARGLTYILNDIALLLFSYYVFVGLVPIWENITQLGAVVQSLNVSQIYFFVAVPIGFALITIRTFQVLYIDVRTVVFDEPVYDGEGIIGSE